MRILRFSVLLLLIGCSSVPDADKFKNQPVPAEKPGYVLVYVYREDRLAYDKDSVLIRDANQSIALLANASYAYFWLKPGRHTLSSSAWGLVGGTEHTDDFADGHDYYLKIVFKKFDPTLVLMEAAFVSVDPATARDEIADLRLAAASK